MRSAEPLLNFMNRLQELIGRVNGYIEQGIEIFLKVRDWIHKILEYIEKGINKLSQYVEEHKEDFLEFQQDDLFV